jgi:hypothetical protein
MPWRGAEYDGEFPSLGWQILDWLRSEFTVPDGPLAGAPFALSDQQTAILVKFYGLDNRGKFLFRRGSWRAPQGAGKSPLLGGIALAELCGPVAFDGWSADGEPVARQRPTPWVQVAAVSEDQTENTYGALYTMAAESALAGSVLDVGKTSIHLVDGPGTLEPVTASAPTRLGQRLTFAVLDETHLWTPRNGGKKLAGVLRRNTGKMDGRTFESTNAFLRGEDSVAEATWESAEQAAPGVLYEACEAPHVEDLTDTAAVRHALTVAYSDSVAWVDVERLVLEIADTGTDPDDARRFFLNQIVTGGACPVDLAVWDQLGDVDRLVEPGAYIGVGFDGSSFQDRTVLYGCTADYHVFEIAVWQRPEDALPDWQIPRREVHETLREIMERYHVGRMFADPSRWESEVESWSRLYPDVALALYMSRTRAWSRACDRFATAVRARTLTHDGKQRLRLSLAACKKETVRLKDDEDDGHTAFIIKRADTRKIDEAVGAHLALEAAATMPPLPPPRTYSGMLIERP